MSEKEAFDREKQANLAKKAYQAHQAEHGVAHQAGDVNEAETPKPMAKPAVKPAAKPSIAHAAGAAPAAPATPVAPAAPAAPAFIAQHKVVSGDTLSGIALKYYKSAEREKWMAIYEANKETIGNNPSMIKIGQVLQIPDLD